jgi:hypothetical protein
MTILTNALPPVVPPGTDPTEIDYPVPFPYGVQENTTGLPGAMTTEYHVRRHRIYYSGTHIVPVAGAAGTAAQFVNLHAPYGIEMVYWAAVKEGQPPIVPDPALFSDGNHTFLWGEQAADAPMLLPTMAAHVWIMAGIYYYGFTQPVQLNADFPTAAMPFDPMTPDQATYPKENFNTGIFSGGGDIRTGLPTMLQQSKGPGG